MANRRGQLRTIFVNRNGLVRIVSEPNDRLGSESRE